MEAGICVDEIRALLQEKSQVESTETATDEQVRIMKEQQELLQPERILEPSLRGHYYVWLVVCSILVTLTALLLYSPFIQRFPGGDTPAYVELMHGFENHGLSWALYSQKRPLVSLILYALYLVVPKGDYLAAITLTTAAYVTLSSFLLSVFSLLLLRKLNVGKLGAFLCVLCGYVIWIFSYLGDLYANFLAFALMFAFAYFYTDALDGAKRDGVFCGIILAVMFFVHEETAYVTIAIAVLSLMLRLAHNKGKWSKGWLPVIISLSTACVILLPFLFLAFNDANYLGIFSTIIGPVQARYGNFATLSSSLAKPIAVDDYNIAAARVALSGFPNILKLTLIIFGIVVAGLNMRRKPPTSASIILYSWLFVVLLCITVGSIPIIIGTPNAISTYVWRFALLIPSPLLLGLLVESPSAFNRPFLLRIKGKLRYFAHVGIDKKDLKSIGTGILITIVALSLNVSIQYKFLYSGSPQPSESTINDTLALREMFGYGNKSVVLYVQNNDERKIEWITAITGISVFYGSSIWDLYLGIFDEQLSNDVVYMASTNVLQKEGVFGNVGNLTIVTAETFASLTPLESEMVAQTISNPGGSQIKIFRTISKDYANTMYIHSQKLYDPNTVIGDPLDFGNEFWKAYLGLGPRHARAGWGCNVTIAKGDSLIQSYIFNLTEGDYYIRLYHIFESPRNFTSSKYLRLIIYCNLQDSTSKQLGLQLGSDVIAGGASLDRGDYTFTCISGQKSVVFVPLGNLEILGNFDLSYVNQLIFRLDQDIVRGEITISEITDL